MKKHLLVKIVCLFCIVSFTAAQAKITTNSNTTMITQTINAWMKKNNIPGVAVETYEKGVLHSYYFGYANRETKKPINSKTIFEIGSLTKLFTSLLFAIEIDANKANLTDSIANYLPEIITQSNSPLRKITLQNLATHTAALPFTLPDTIKTQADLDSFLSKWNPPYPIGKQWAYSNVGIGLLGNSLELITHENFNQLYRGRILQPLGMEPIGIIVPKRLLSNYAQGYNDQGTAVQRDQINLLFPASGDMKVSAHDMLRFLKAAIGLPGVPVAIAHAMQITQISYVSTVNMNQGLGWSIYPEVENHKVELLDPPETMIMGPIPAKQFNKNEYKFDGNALIDKTGATDGFRSYIAVIPNKKSGIVILANRSASNGEIMRVGRKILFNVIGSI